MTQHARWRIVIAQHQRLPRPRDAGFLETDLLDVIAEPILMIQIDRGDHRRIGIDLSLIHI